MLSAAGVCSVSWRSRSGRLARSRPAAAFSTGSAWSARISPCSTRPVRPMPFPGWAPWSPLTLLPPESCHYRAVFFLDRWTPHGDGRELFFSETSIGVVGADTKPSVPPSSDASPSSSVPPGSDTSRSSTAPPGSDASPALAPLSARTRFQALASLPGHSSGSAGIAPTRGGSCQVSSLFSTTLSACACLGDVSRV